MSLPADHAESLLHDLPHLQLGSSDDVYALFVRKRVLWMEPAGSGHRGGRSVGDMRNALSRKILGPEQRGFAVHSVHG